MPYRKDLSAVHSVNPEVLRATEGRAVAEMVRDMLRRVAVDSYAIGGTADWSTLDLTGTLVPVILDSSDPGFDVFRLQLRVTVDVPD